WGLVSYTIYMNIELRMSLEQVNNSLNRVFSLDLASGTAWRMKDHAADKYRSTYNGIVRELCAGNLLHVDETKINTKGQDGVVWVFASMTNVIYMYRDTREGAFLKDMLS